MKQSIKVGVRGFLSAVVFIFAASPALAATSPSLGMANGFTILSSTYTNTVSGTTLNGNLGYTTPPAVTPTVNGTTHLADSTYNQAGIDQATTLSALNSQPCTFTFAPGAIDLASDTTHGAIGVYGPGVYCVSGVASVGGGGTITLSGSGTYIFRMTGALNTSANSVVAMSNGASACDVWWTPGAATTLGANSTFIGTDIDAAGISIGNLVTWIGKALAFGGTVSTDSNTITTSICTASVPTATPVASVTPSPKATKIPGLPNTGRHQPASEVDYSGIALIVGLLTVSSLLYVVGKKSKTSSN